MEHEGLDCQGELRAALKKIDLALAEKPRTDGHVFSSAARHLCAVRDELIAQQGRLGEDPVRRRHLAHLNGVISVILAGHFPLGEVPWTELELARCWLADLETERSAA